MGITERKEREKNVRREAIIQAAEKLFFSKGIDNSTMDDVASEAELSKGTLYLYFNTKEELNHAICIKGFEILARKLKRALRKNQKGAENLLSLARAYIRFSKENSNYFKTIILFESSKTEKIIEENKNNILSPGFPLMLMIEVIEKGKKDGTIRKDIGSTEMAIILWSQMTGTLQFMLYKPEIMKILGLKSDAMLLDHFRTIQDGIIRKIKLV
jgi:TetR/AcrR family transcriptional regulator